MSNKPVQSDAGLRTLNVRPSAAEAIGELAEERGMLKYRMVDLLLKGWGMLSEKQKSDAHRQLARQRQAVSA